MARYKHAMYFLRSANMIMIIGGRRLGDLKGSDINAEFIKETNVLNMLTLEWSTISFTGYQINGIYNFSSCQHEEDIYIFGGTVDPHHLTKKLLRIRDVTNG